MFSVGFLPPLLVTGVMMVLLLKQPDFGTAAILARSRSACCSSRARAPAT